MGNLSLNTPFPNSSTPEDCLVVNCFLEDCHSVYYPVEITNWKTVEEENYALLFFKKNSTMNNILFQDYRNNFAETRDEIWRN